VSKRLLTLIVLAAVLGGAIGAYFIVKSIPPKVPEDTGTARIQIDRLDVEKLQKMVLESRERTLTLVKKDGSWKLDVSYDVELDQSKIEDIAYSFSSMYAESLVEEKAADLAPYGLDKPAQKATAKRSAKRAQAAAARTRTGKSVPAALAYSRSQSPLGEASQKSS